MFRKILKFYEDLTTRLELSSAANALERSIHALAASASADPADPADLDAFLPRLRTLFDKYEAIPDKSILPSALRERTEALIKQGIEKQTHMLMAASLSLLDVRNNAVAVFTCFTCQHWHLHAKTQVQQILLPQVVDEQASSISTRLIYRQCSIQLIGALGSQAISVVNSTETRVGFTVMTEMEAKEMKTTSSREAMNAEMIASMVQLGAQLNPGSTAEPESPSLSESSTESESPRLGR